MDEQSSLFGQSDSDEISFTTITKGVWNHIQPSLIFAIKAWDCQSLKDKLLALQTNKTRVKVIDID